MKNNYSVRQRIFRCLLLLLLAIPWTANAQSGFYLSWNFEVGCKEYRGEKTEEYANGVSLETIESSDCVRVCEGSSVIYKVNGSNISNVSWTVSGGTLGTVSGPGNTQAVINWGNAGNGAIQLSITYANGTTEDKTVCIEKINSPVADFKIQGIDDLSICQNTPVYFDNLSSQNGGTDIVSYLWDFGDGTTSTAFEPSHVYSQPGGYAVSLTVTNKCNCTSNYSMEVFVLESPPVQINCASVVCEGSTERYSVEDGCGSGEWDVIGGTIITNSGNYIDVVWDQVDPADGFGYVMYKSECGCPVWSSIKIPVILRRGEIKGETTVCTNKQYKYSLPQWPTTHFQWNVLGPAGDLVYNQQRNEILFTASQPGTYTLSCTYYNTLLDCGGVTEINIIADDPVSVQGGSSEICTGSSQTYTASPNVPVIWRVTQGNTVVATSALTSAPYTYTFVSPGTYIVTATKPGGCTGEGKIVKVIPKPAAPSGTISGEAIVCPGTPYTYTLVPTNAGFLPLWEVTNGTIQGNNTGSSVTVVFDPLASPYSVSVRNRTADALGCLSDPVYLNVTKVNHSLVSINPNPGPFCPSSTASFSANLNGIVPDSMEWSFASLNFGSFVSGQGTANITVNFNEISNTDTTYLLFTIVKCGKSYTDSIEVTLKKLPVISILNTELCISDNLVFYIDQGSVGSGSTVTFTFPNGTTHSEPYNSSGTYSFPNNGYIQNNTGVNISQTVQVTITDANGCHYNPTASADLIIFPETFVTITPAYNVLICDPNDYQPYTLYANLSTGITLTTTFQWVKDGNDIPGATSDSYTINGSSPFGIYYVRVKDKNDCWAQSATIEVKQFCPIPENCYEDPKISFTPVWSGCKTVTVSNVSYIGTPDEIEWVSNNILTIVSGQGTNSPVFETNIAGVHLVVLRLRFGNCWYSQAVEVRKHYDPKFVISETCNGNGTFDVTLHNNSMIFDINPGTITYTFSGTGLPTQTGQAVTYSGLAPGTYTFTMTMSAPGMPVCTKTETYTVKPEPNLNFTVPSQVCKGDVITLTPSGYDPANTYTWYFDNTSFIMSGSSTEITFNNVTTTNSVQLVITTPQGCVYTSPTKIITVNVANYKGSLFPSSINVCEGQSVPPIVYTQLSGGIPSGFIWMNGSQPVLGAPNSGTFTPITSGSYWPVLVSSQGCRSYIMANSPVNVTIRPKPYVNIAARAEVCAGESVTLHGIVTDNTLEYQWVEGLNILVPWTSSPYPISYTTGSLTAGTYTYMLLVRPAGTTTGCSSSKSFTITVSDPPPAPVLSYNYQSCQPYEVVITASGPSTGVYNWSNGMTGQSITVTEGGVYGVTYTAPSGCKVSSEIQIPLSLESLMWVFPTGCYDDCLERRYILGPKGVFDYHEWQLFGSNIQDGSNDFIYPLFLSNAGTYQLTIISGGCHITSGMMNLFPHPEKCSIEVECDYAAHIEAIEGDGNPYILYGVIVNNGSQPISLTVSSANGYGTYSPSIITIPGGGTYNLFNNPLLFYANSNFSGGADQIRLQTLLCDYETDLSFPYFRTAAPQSPGGTGTVNTASLKLVPNPAKEKVAVSYDTGNKEVNARLITIHDAAGAIRYRKEVTGSSGTADVNISGWLQGTYLVLVHTNDKPLQGRLLKE